MAKRVEPGYYKCGRIDPEAPGNPRPRKCGEYGVIRGDKIEETGHLEWSHICEGLIKRSKWAVYRIGPGDNGRGSRTDLIQACDSKKEAVEVVERRYEDKFTEVF